MQNSGIRGLDVDRLESHVIGSFNGDDVALPTPVLCRANLEQNRAAGFNAVP